MISITRNTIRNCKTGISVPANSSVMIDGNDMQEVEVAVEIRETLDDFNKFINDLSEINRKEKRYIIKEITSTMGRKSISNKVLENTKKKIQDYLSEIQKAYLIPVIMEGINKLFNSIF